LTEAESAKKRQLYRPSAIEAQSERVTFGLQNFRFACKGQLAQELARLERLS
jgi:hypothetical protein